MQNGVDCSGDVHKRARTLIADLELTVCSIETQAKHPELIPLHQANRIREHREVQRILGFTLPRHGGPERGPADAKSAAVGGRSAL